MRIETSNATGVSEVGRFNVRYSIVNDREGNPVTCTANIYDGLTVVGTANSNNVGEFGISVTERAAMTVAERSAVVTQVLNDFADIFTSEAATEEAAE